MSAPDKCPKCGAAPCFNGDGTFAMEFLCGSVPDLKGQVIRQWQSHECLNRQRDDLLARVKRLEEAGQKCRDCAGQLGYTSADDSNWIMLADKAVKEWDEVREAKP